MALARALALAVAEGWMTAADVDGLFEKLRLSALDASAGAIADSDALRWQE